MYVPTNQAIYKVDSQINDYCSNSLPTRKLQT